MHNHMNKRSKLEHLNMWHFSILQLRLSCLDFNITWLCLEPRSSYPLPLFLKWEEEMWAIKSARKSFNIWKSWFYITLDPYTLFLFASLPLSLSQEEKAKVIQTLLFVAGLNTLLQTWFGTRLPVVIGGSYTFVAPTISIILSGRWDDPDPISVCGFDPDAVLYVNWNFNSLIVRIVL